MALKHTNPTQPRFDRKDKVRVEAVAPYNFVPLPDKMVKAQSLLDHDRYFLDPVAVTGWIDCELETCSPVYIRGMLTEKQFADFGQDGPENLTDEQKRIMATFFSLEQDVPLIPGSSLRGMIRQLVEIVGYGRMRYVSPTPTFTYRAVAAQNDDPLRDPYRQVVGAFARNVRPGTLEKRGDEWWIHPTLLPSSLNLAERGAFLKIKERSIPSGTIPGLYPLSNKDYRPLWYDVSFDLEDRQGKRGKYTVVTRIGSRKDNYRYQGTLVCSGNMMETGEKTNRKNHALILTKDTRSAAVKIDPQAVQDYRDGLTPYQEELAAWGGKGWGCLKDGAPIFFVPEGSKIRYFGHSPNFRIPARLNLPGETRAANPRDFVPGHLRESPQPDMAEAMFGWVEEKEQEKVIGPEKQRAGRVFFSDARFESAANGLWFKEEPITPHVLSGPKSTTFQHYLVQDDRVGRNGHHPDNKVALAHYGTPPSETQIRGYKLYWHKGATPDIEANDTERQHPKQLTQIKPVKAGVRFHFKVYFENLRPEEVGLLWWSLALPGEPSKQYRHKLGMGKPLGMGAVAITPQLFITNRSVRYETLFNDGQWQTGAQTAASQPFLNSLNRYLLQEQGLDTQLQNITELERIQMLLTMLEWREGSPEWLDKTRYMEIERPTGYRRPNGQPETRNEYKERPVLPDPKGVVADLVRSRSSSQRPFGGSGQGGPQRREPGGRSEQREQQASPSPAPKVDSPAKPELPSKAPSTSPQIGERVVGKVDLIEQNGDVYLRPEKAPYQQWLLRVKRDQHEGISYQPGQMRACIVLQLWPDDEVVECKPAPKKK